MLRLYGIRKVMNDNCQCDVIIFVNCGMLLIALCVCIACYTFSCYILMLHFADHLFFHKWALLTDPDDFLSGPKGYLKCDVGIIGKGDTVKVPPRSDKDPDDIEA